MKMPFDFISMEFWNCAVDATWWSYSVFDRCCRPFSNKIRTNIRLVSMRYTWAGNHIYHSLTIHQLVTTVGSTFEAVEMTVDRFIGSQFQRKYNNRLESLLRVPLRTPAIWCGLLFFFLYWWVNFMLLPNRKIKAAISPVNSNQLMIEFNDVIACI